MSTDSLENTKNRMWYVINVLLLGIFAFFVVNIARLYYHYVVHVDGEDSFVSDIPIHIRTALNAEKTGYSLNNLVVRFLFRLTGTELSVAVWLVFLIVATCVVCGVVAWLAFGKPDRRYWPSLLLLGTAPWFIGAIYIPHFYPYHYTGTLAVNSWHNTTLIESRFFAIIALLLFYLVMKRIREESGFFVPWILFVGFLLLTTGFKTNFYISFCPLAGIILIVYLIRLLKNREWKRSLYVFLTGIGILAVLPVLFYQGGTVYSGEGTNAFTISFGTVFMHNAPNAVLKVLLSVLPFAAVFAYSIYKKRVTKEWMFLIGLFCIDLMVLLIFAESGSRMYHGNFGWGRQISMFILNFIALLQYCRYMIEMRRGEHQEVVDTVALTAITVIFFAAIASGILYFYKIAWGGYGYLI